MQHLGERLSWVGRQCCAGYPGSLILVRRMFFLLRQVKHALLSGLLKKKTLRGSCKGADKKVSGSRKG